MFEKQRSRRRNRHSRSRRHQDKSASLHPFHIDSDEDSHQNGTFSMHTQEEMQSAFICSNEERYIDDATKISRLTTQLKRALSNPGDRNVVVSPTNSDHVNVSVYSRPHFSLSPFASVDISTCSRIKPHRSSISHLRHSSARFGSSRLPSSLTSPHHHGHISERNIGLTM